MSEAGLLQATVTHIEPATATIAARAVEDMRMTFLLSWPYAAHQRSIGCAAAARKLGLTVLAAACLARNS